jgi:uncharacterized membrane-anchored protein
MKIHTVLLWLTAIVIVLGVNISVFQREGLATSGELIYLELVPVDPRSLIQGDYMRLRYAISQELQEQIPFGTKGTLIVSLDSDSIGRFDRFDSSQIPIAANEVRMKYHWRGSSIYIGPESFFFQEGHASYYFDARYAELRVSEMGDVLLIGLRDENLASLGQTQ